MHGPSHSFSRRKALADLSRMATEWPSALSEMARPDPTRPHPTTMTCTPQCNTPRRVLQRRTGTWTGTSGDCFYCVAVATPITAAPEKATPPPVPLPGLTAESIPETRRYRLKNKLLGAAPGHRAARLGAPAAAHRPGRAGARLHLVLGLRHRGDADPAGALRRPGRLRPGRSHHHRHPGRPLLRHPLVPGGHSALHQGRRFLRRGPRQLRSAHRADRGRGAVDRLHGDGRRADVGRHRRAHQRRAQPDEVHRRDHGGRDPAPPLRQPARHPRGRELLRHPDVLLHLLVGECHCHRVRQGGSGHAALHPAAPGERGVRREDRHTR